MRFSKLVLTIQLYLIKGGGIKLKTTMFS